MISTAIRVARVGSAAQLAAAVLMMAGYPALMLAALVPSVPAFAAAAAVTYLADHYLHRKGSYLINRLSKVRACLSIRFLIRQLLLVLLLARLSLADNLIYYGAIACFIAFYGLQAPHGALVQLIRNRRRMPVATRNVDLKSRIRIPDAPPRKLLHRSAEKMLHIDLFAVSRHPARRAGEVRPRRLRRHRRHGGPRHAVRAGARAVRARPEDPAERRAGPGRRRRLAGRVPAGDGPVLLRFEGLRLPGQHVAGHHGETGLQAADHPA